MRNKGAIWFLAIALALVSLYQLSFSWKTSQVRKDAREYAKGDEELMNHYLDSISGEEVYNFLFGIKKYTYRECQARELNLGLDLKGGMNVILEVSVEDVIRSLANYSQDTTFNNALSRANQLQKTGQEDFVTLFGRAFEEIDPNARLAAIFNTVELRDKISFNSTNDEVLDVIREEANDAISNSFNIISTRIDQFGVTQPNIQRLETHDRILVELPGVKDKDRVRKLLQGTANLEFWETYENSEIYQSLLDANEVIKQSIEVEESARKEEQGVFKDESDTTDTPGFLSDIDEVSGEEEEEPSLLQQLEQDTTAVDSTSEDEMAREYPLFNVLYPNTDREGNLGRGSVIGRSHSSDTARVNKYMKIAEEKNIFPRDFKYLWSANPILDPSTGKPGDFYELHAIKITSRDGQAPLDGEVITAAAQEFDQNQGFAYVTMSMDGEGSKIWARMTRENIDRVICVVMDDKVYSDAVVQGEITGGNTQITGNFSVNDAQDLANLLKSGKLPAPARIIQETVIGPSLGHEAVTSGLNSFIIAFLFVLLYMLFYYSRRAGMVADIALLVNMFFIFGILASLGAALTLPGIAGIVLTIGMSVDANVLIYERIREELAAGKGVKLAISDGYKNAYSAIIDANVTTGITALILYMFGKGPIKGFATTLGIGIVTSLFTAIFITRLIYEWYLNKGMKITFATRLTEGAFKKLNIDFIGHRKNYYILSAVIILAGIGSLMIRGLDPGVDFTGGRNYVIRFDEPVSTQEIARALEDELQEIPKVIIYGEDNQVRITTSYKIDSDDPAVDDEIQELLYAGLQPFYGEGVSYEEFYEDYWQSNQKVGPSIADDIQRQAVLVIFVALVFMFLYIILRFRNWQFGLGAIMALVHDSLIVLGIFSIFYGMMPFSLEIDQAFIAAILTVVGYSINDTVVIFDRIREYTGLYRKRDRSEIINLALNSTLSRTFSTSMSTFVVLLAIFIFGGEVIRGFVFALLIGIIVGTYSSLFIATPVVYDTVYTRKKKEVKGKKR